jgi:hypothetical protein
VAEQIAIQSGARVVWVPGMTAEGGHYGDHLDDVVRDVFGANAAGSGQYPQGYKYAIDIYYNEGKLDLIDAPLEELARQHGPMADWAAYKRFKMAHTRWERSGAKDAKLKDQWLALAREYVQHYPHGHYAYEPRFRLAELLQADHKYGDAASAYDQVRGDPFYQYAATAKSAECRYRNSRSRRRPAGKPARWRRARRIP